MSGSSNQEPEEAAAARIRQAELLEIVGRLAGGVAHDLNNLLATILGYGELLENQLRARGDALAERNDLTEILKATERTQDLTQRLLAFAQKLTTRAALIEPQQIVRGIERLLRRLAPPQTEFLVSLTSASGWIEVDRARIEQALTCLVVNGFDAMPEGGTLTISAEWRDLNSEGLPVGVVVGRDEHLAGPCIEFRVSDTGRGMSAEYIRQAFGPYVTTKETDAIGEGLGLAAVYGLVARAHGLVIVNSALHVGTTVHILIPRASAVAGEETDPSR